MSEQPEESEVEEGEIVEEGEQSETETEFGDEGIDVASLMTSIFASEDGDTVCSALVDIAHQLRTHNKIMIKILNNMKNN
jgi:hypothetical protein